MKKNMKPPAPASATGPDPTSPHRPQGPAVSQAAFELAKVAAILRPGDCTGKEAKTAIEKALALVYAANHVLSELATLPAEELSGRILASLHDLGFKDDLVMKLKASTELRLYRNDGVANDPVKEYLAANTSRFNWQKTRTVLTAIENYFVERANAHNKRYASGIETMDRNHRHLADERNITLEELRNGMLIPKEQRWMDGFQNYRQFLAQAQRPPGVADKLEVRILPGRDKVLRETAVLVPVETKVEYWLLSQEFLSHLIAWRIRIKDGKVPWKGIRPLSREEIFGGVLSGAKVAKKKTPK